MLSLRERLQQPGSLLADGAMGTMLLRRGLKPGECPERLNLERPEILEEIASLYIQAGAEIIQTNTFGGSPLKLAPYGLDDRTEEINARAVRAARSVAANRAYLYGSCGPSGKILEPYGDATEDEVFESFRRQMTTLVSEGVDMIGIETMTDLAEATLAIKAARAVHPKIPISASMTFDETPAGYFTLMGTSVDQAIEGLSRAGADLVGSNCGNGILTMVEIAKEFARRTAMPVIIQSNAGLPKLTDGISVYPETPDYMADHSRPLLEIGVKIIGGCCGTTPQHISALRLTADRFAHAR